ncbi:hypothetical protein [Plantibacter sp. MMLR14_011]|uniref:hypothetical protein n=1 Tax=Plantibacter sp. MMLR14_011 TaxID=1898746 RepID=UPI0008DD930A|nr:hypothetical protein [Plantibacter sp. MMLR14_011]OII39284.1 hypothetical protein BIU99_07840 [Plantibacter sp. MMLR14_011]
MLVVAPKTLNYQAEAKAFFNGLKKASPERLQAVLNEGAYDAKLSFVLWESRDWIAREHIREARGLGYGREKALAKQRTQSLLGLYREDAKRNYVPLPTRVLLPPPRLHETSSAEQRLAKQRANIFFSALSRASPDRLEALYKERRGNEQLWRLLHPEPGRPTPEERRKIFESRMRIDPAMRPTAPTGPYKRGTVTPVGMTRERALQLAVEAERRREAEQRARRASRGRNGPAMS